MNGPDQKAWPSPHMLPATRLDSLMGIVKDPPKGKGQKGGKGQVPWPLQWQQGEQESQSWNAPQGQSAPPGPKHSGPRQRGQRRQQAKSENKHWDNPKPVGDEDMWNMWQETARWENERQRGENSSQPSQQRRQQQSKGPRDKEQHLQQQLQVQLGLLEESIEASKVSKGKGKASFHGLSALEHPRGDLHTGSSSSSMSKDKDVFSQEGSGPGLSNMSRLRRNKWINRQVTRIADTGNLQRLLQTVQFHMSEMNGINLATALHRVTKLVVNSISGISTQQLLRHPSFQLLRATVVQHIEMHRLKKPGSPAADEPVFEVQCMSIVCWSCATLRLHEEKLLETIADIVLPCLNELKPFELSNMLWAYAKLSLGKPSLLNAVAERMLNREWGEFSMQCLSMIAWSFATEKHRDLPVFSSIACEIVANAATTRPQEIANTLWAYAKNRCVEVPLFNALAETAISQNMLWSFKSQELSNTVWAFATIGLQHQLLFKHAVTVAISKRRELSPQNIANILWAYAKLQVCRGSGLFPALLSVSVGMMAQHKPHEISAIVWAAAKAEVKLDVEENYPACRRFFSATAHMCRERLHEFPPQALANMVEAFAIIEADFPSFSEAMARESVGRLHQFDPMALANLFRGVVLVARRQQSQGSAEHERNLAVLAAIGAHVALRIGELQPGDVAHVEHSLQLLGPSARALNTGGLDQSVLKAMMRRFDPRKGKGSEGPSLRTRDIAHGNLEDEFDIDADDMVNEIESVQEGVSNTDILLGDFVHDLDNVDEQENEFEEDQRDNYHQPRPYSMWGPPSGKGYSKGGAHGWHKGGGGSNSFYNGGGWSGGGKRGGNRNRGGGRGGSGQAQEAHWMMGQQAWTPWGQGFATPPSAYDAQQSPASGVAPGLDPLGGSQSALHMQYEEPMGTLMSPMQVGWQGNGGVDEFSGHPHSQGNQQGAWSSGLSAWWEDGAPSNDPLWYGKETLWPSPEDEEWQQQGTAPSSSFAAADSAAAAGNAYESALPARVPEQDDAVQSWKPRVVDVSCFVQMVDATQEDSGSLGTVTWRPVDLQYHPAVLGAAQDVVHLWYGVFDVRVVLKRTAACEAQMPGPQCPNVLCPIALLKVEEACYLAYPYCPHGTLAEWISERNQIGRPPRIGESVDIVLGVLQAASIFMTKGAGLSSLRADEIFLDNEMQPRVRIRHTRTCGKWLAPQDPQVTFTPPLSDAWPVVVFKIGLILYCLGAHTPDPYPDKSADEVLQGMQQEASGAGYPLRPDFSQFRGAKMLRDVMEKCLSKQASECPDQNTLTDMLEDIKRRIAQNHQ